MKRIAEPPRLPSSLRLRAAPCLAVLQLGLTSDVSCFASRTGCSGPRCSASRPASTQSCPRFPAARLPRSSSPCTTQTAASTMPRGIPAAFPCRSIHHFLNRAGSSFTFVVHTTERTPASAGGFWVEEENPAAAGVVLPEGAAGSGASASASVRQKQLPT